MRNIKSGALLTTQLRPNSVQLKINFEAKNAERKKEVNRSFFSLSRQKIEEDIFKLIGAKSFKRQKKRAKHVQRLDV